MNSFKWVFNIHSIKQEFIHFIFVSLIVLLVLILSFVFVRIELKKIKKEEGKIKDEK